MVYSQAVETDKRQEVVSQHKHDKGGNTPKILKTGDLF